jgi:hypothetical protein
MAKLSFKARITEKRGAGSFEFQHRILYIAAGSYSGFGLTYDAPGGGSYVKDYDNQLAAWKTLSLAIQGTNSLRFTMPMDREAEDYYRKHTELSNAIDGVEILAYDPTKHPGLESREWWETPADQSIEIFAVTVVLPVFTIRAVTTVGLQFNGATKEWF